jgi:GNAT superfamily N-acetyltransferase
MLNRVVGLGVGAEVDPDTVDRCLAAMGDAAFYVSVAPSADARLAALLDDRGLEPGWGWMLFERAADPVSPVETHLDAVTVDAARAEAWAAIVRTAYGLPAASLPLIAAVPSLSGWTAFLAVDGAEPVAAAAAWTDRDAAYLGFAATRPEHRGKGGQGLLLAARIEHAVAAGCRTIVTETGALRGDRPSASYRNILRSGFEERHVVAHRLRPRRG